MTVYIKPATLKSHIWENSRPFGQTDSPYEYKRKYEELNLPDDFYLRASEGVTVGIAQALLNDPRILILDEPTAGLDPGERIRFRNIITEIAKDRMILIATHIVSDVEYIANHIIMLQKGNVICEGTADALRNGIKGQVFSLCVSEEQSKDIQKAYLVSNMKRENDGVYLRVISDHAPEGAKIVEPQLEEVFLSIFKKESDIHENTIL